MIERTGVRIGPFDRAQQDDVRALVLGGLAERWRGIDPTLNRDLGDIAATYQADNVVVALAGGLVVGCGMLVAHGRSDHRRDDGVGVSDSGGAGEVVRVAVAAEWRLRGVATAVLHQLRRRALALGLRRLIVETNDDWVEARALYERFGFTFTHYAAAEFGRGAWYALDLG